MSPQSDPPDEPPIGWQLRDLRRRLDENEANWAMTEKSLGAEINTNIRRDEQLNGEFGLIAAMKTLTLAVEKNTLAIEKDRELAAKRDEERATFLRRTAGGLVVSLIVVIVGAIASGAIHIS